MRNSFFDLLRYSEVPEIDNLSEASVLAELECFVTNDKLSLSCYDYLDYERLIFLQTRFEENQNIQEEISKIRHIIADNYETRKRLLNRLQVKTDF